VIWEPFILALVLGVIVSAGLYFAYLWPSVEPEDEPDDAAAPPPTPTSPEPPPVADADANAASTTP
jgi:hypothetical protein